MRPVPAWRRWFAFLGAGVAWTFHLLSIYAIGEFGSVSGWDRVTYLGISAVAWMILIASAAMLGLAGAAAFLGYRDRKRDERENQPAGEDEGGRYLSWFGSILSALFGLIILVETLPIFAYLEGG